jgi:hypothetical protein
VIAGAFQQIFALLHSGAFPDFAVGVGSGHCPFTPSVFARGHLPSLVEEFQRTAVTAFPPAPVNTNSIPSSLSAPPFLHLDAPPPSHSPFLWHHQSSFLMLLAVLPASLVSFVPRF